MEWRLWCCGLLSCTNCNNSAAAQTRKGKPNKVAYHVSEVPVLAQVARDGDLPRLLVDLEEARRLPVPDDLELERVEEVLRTEQAAVSDNVWTIWILSLTFPCEKATLSCV